MDRVAGTCMRIGLLALAACWTGPEVPTVTPSNRESRSPASHAKLEVTLGRTACFGTCPVYTVTIHPDGRVDWEGEANVAARGTRHGRAKQNELAALARALDYVHFEQLDASGQPPPSPPACTTTNGATICLFDTKVSICSDTSHAVITVRRNGASHTVNDAHCEDGPLEALEAQIDRIAGTATWIGR